jgi:hypothetical protein
MTRSSWISGLVLWLCSFSSVAAAQVQPPWIFGMHDPGAEGEMEARGKRGWIVFTEAIGSDPNDQSGKNFLHWSDRGHGVIVRLNNGYEGSGNLPFESEYGNFAKRVANYIQSSPGADIWIIGNETNLPREWPGNVNGDANTGEAITPQRYINCFNRVRNELIARGLGSEILVPSPTGTWAPPYDGSLPGFPNRGVPGFVDYWVQVLNGLGPSKVSGLAIHAYTHGSDPQLVFSEQKMGPPYQDVNYHFRVYRNFMARIPSDLRHLPVWITEANEFRDQTGYNWDPDPRTIQWVNNAYSEINNWNANASNQKIRTLALFRWPDVWEGDRNYCVSCVGNAVEGFRQALNNDYRWGTGSSGRGAPRVQYAREYWVVDSRASLSEYLQVVDMAYPNRITVGFSYDDAGIGDLNVRKVVVWGDEHDRTVLRNWYQQYYGGVSVEFRALPGRGTWRFGPYATTPPASGRGAPRVQYAREYWVVHSQASLAQFRGVASSGYSGRKTVGFSYDDAGIGDLNQRTVVVWGGEFPQQTLRDWYNQYYPGVAVSFRNFLTAGLFDRSAVTSFSTSSR